jgi:hypothetical protein
LELPPASGQLRNHFLAWAFAGTLAIGYLGVMEIALAAYSALGLAALAVLYYFLPYPAHPANLTYHPFRTIAMVMILILATLFTFQNDVPPMDWEALVQGKHLSAWAGSINFAVLITLLLGGAILVFFYKQKTPLDLLIAIFPVVAILWITIARMEYPWPALIIGNIYLLALAGWLIYEGIQKTSLRILNTGMLFFLVWVIARFFDTDWSFMIKGTLFIFLGAGYFGRKCLGKQKTEIKKNKNLSSYVLSQ